MELVDCIAAIVPKHNRVCQIEYYAIFTKRDVAARFLSNPDVQVAYVDVVFNEALPVARAVYHIDEGIKTRLYQRTQLPDYVKRYLESHIDNQSDLDYIRIWGDRSQ